MKHLYTLLAAAGLTALSAAPVNAENLPTRDKTAWCRFSAAELQGEIRIPVVFMNLTANYTYDWNANDWAGNDALAVTAAHQDKWMRQLNVACDENFLGEAGSVQDFFAAQSYGKLKVSFEKVGVVNGGDGYDLYEYADQAAKLKSTLPGLSGVDWSRYDSNHDGEVDCILCIFAGHAMGDTTVEGYENENIYPNRNWMSNLAGGKLQLGSVVADSYVFVNDLRNASNDIDGISTVAHELGHGIFDLNDYYQNRVSYVGQYDAMDFGFRQLSDQRTYMPKGEHPCGYTSFNRMYLGWLTPVELTEPCTVTLHSLDANAEACLIADPNDDQHFYMLEYRAKNAASWDAHLPGEGLVVTEINYAPDAFDYHSVNAGEVKNIRLINANTGTGVAVAADGYYGFSQYQVAFGTNGKTSIPETAGAVFSTKTVTNIKVGDDGTVAFDFMGGGTPLSISAVHDDLHSGNYVRKELRNGVCYITRDKTRYNLHGQIVK